jgi:hypothetical protein
MRTLTFFRVPRKLSAAATVFPALLPWQSGWGFVIYETPASLVEWQLACSVTFKSETEAKAAYAAVSAALEKAIIVRRN